MVPEKSYVIGIDRGGTFTDVVAWCSDGAVTTMKILSEQSSSITGAEVRGIREILKLAPQERLPEDRIKVVRMGTTVGTNALLQRKGEPVALVVTQGFKDAIRIGYQDRPSLFDLRIKLPDLLYSRVLEVNERIDAEGSVLLPLNPVTVRRGLVELYSAGFRSCAIAFMHSYRFPAHEEAVSELAREVGFEQVSLSSECSRLVKFVGRAETAVVDAYLTPVLNRHVDNVKRSLGGVPVLMMQSNGGLARAETFRGKDSILSGPAGGIVGAVAVCTAAGFDRIIGFDMGGTSTDVSHYAGSFERTTENQIAGVRLRAPTMSINTVAAGGGSILKLQGNRFRVGPDSAGAVPGPACYRNGGPLTVTDCNVVLGRLSPALFPAIFGPDGNQPLDDAASRRLFEELAQTTERDIGIRKSVYECAEGFLRIAVENMANAIKKISVERGYDVTQYTLCSFGGAGGQHACQVADALGINRVFVHPMAGVLSAYGMGLADVRVIEEESVEVLLEPAQELEFEQRLDRLADKAMQRLRDQGIPVENISTLRRSVIRYKGSHVGIEVPCRRIGEAGQAFVDAYRARYGFTLEGKALLVESLVVEAVGFLEELTEDALKPAVQSDSQAECTSSVYLGGLWKDVPVYRLEKLSNAQVLVGPAIVIDPNATTIVEPGWSAHVLPNGALTMTRLEARSDFHAATSQADPILLELFSNRFRAIADQMGHALANTAHSVNIKERLDFSCAVFDQDCELIANAPHMPLHLGAMSEGVRAIVRKFEGTIRPGDIYVLNSPYEGGAHLPDVNVYMPIFDRHGKSIIFFTGARGHHADIGGKTPGSMPPHSESIEEEGALIEPALLVRDGEFFGQKIRTILASAKYPARNPDQNMADLQAQVAACVRGKSEIDGLCSEFGENVAVAYAAHTIAMAEEEVRRVITRLSNGEFRREHDLGFHVSVRITIDRESRSAVIDFTDTSAQVSYNFNAPSAIARSAALFVFRTLIDRDIPLNAGCLRPLKIVIPARSLLNPEYPAPVSSGNPETSVLVTDALYGALGFIGCSQGTMNNFTFGDAVYQYYETICGGAGAVDGFPGTSAVHTTMTNSRMTDPEIFELRFPILLEEFSIRPDSGGAGRYRGGDGTKRRVRFRRAMEMAIVSNCRRVPPYGADGGGPGAVGINKVYRSNGEVLNLAGCDHAYLEPGDVFEIQTPGGGGYGAVVTG